LHFVIYPQLHQDYLTLHLQWVKCTIQNKIITAFPYSGTCRILLKLNIL
jgi:hypothetical protein